MNNYFIILASGQSKRFNSKKPKQFITYKNKALFEHSLDKAISSKFFKKVILVVNDKRQIKKKYPKEQLKVVIAFDCRHQSQSLAKIVADVFTANGIYCYLFSELRPTPELSFAVRHLKTHCGIVLTASHNPPEYNGYKVYGKDGGQLVPPDDKSVINEIEKNIFRHLISWIKKHSNSI